MTRKLLLVIGLAMGATSVHGADAKRATTAAPDEQSAACRTRATDSPDRPRIGLALGGGGARGIAHISVLRALEQMHIPVDCIAGTSMGSLVGAMYASGMPLDDIEKLVLELDWAELLDDSLERPERSFRRKTDDLLVISQPGVGIGTKGVRIAAGIVGGERILLMFQKLLLPVGAIEDFNRLPIPYRAVAADINDGSAVVIQGGDLALAMRASMSIPGAFPPVVIGQHVLVDGGVARNVPVDVVRNMGADIVIAVDVGTPLAKITSETSVLGIAEQIAGLLTVSNTREQLATLTDHDVLISPPLGDRVATADFDKGPEALEIGNAGVDAVRDQLARLSISEGSYTQHRLQRVGRSSEPPVIAFVRLYNQSRYSDEVLLARIHDPVGKPLDVVRMEKEMLRLFGLKTLALSTYEIVEEEGRTGVVLHVREKVQGPNYLELGLSMASDLEGHFDFNFRLGLLNSPINDSGGEVRSLIQLGDEPQLLGEYYQPFGAVGEWFFATRLQYDDRKLNIFNTSGQKVAEYGARQLGGAVTFGRELSNYGAVNLGFRRVGGQARLLVGDPQLPDFDFDAGEAFLEATVDRLDSLFLPTSGYLARSRYAFSRESFGADTEFEQLDFDAFAARSFGEHTLQLGARYHVTTSGAAPIHALYRLGGFSRLAGYTPGELTGQHYAVLLGGYLYRFGDLFGQKAYAGGSLEYGNAFQDRSGMDFDAGVLNGSAYLGVDSWVGPILLGVGAREGGQHNLFLVIGQRL